MEPVEIKWLERAQQGDLPAFERLVICHDRYIMRLIRSMVNSASAEDIYQETFLKAFTSLSSFRAESEFRTWLSRIAINQCLSHRRRQRWRQWVALEEEQDTGRQPLPPLSSADMPQDQQAVRREMWDHLLKELDRLPDAQRAAFVLKYLHGCSIREVASIMDKAEGTVKSDLFRAMQKIKLRMQRIYA